MTITVRPCLPADEEAWLRCRVLAFLHSAYFDDVRTDHPVPAPGLLAEDSLQWVAEDEDGGIVGVMDVEVGAAGTDEAHLATIDTVAVHPDHQGRGIAGRLLEAVLEQLPARVRTLDAWTRDDAAAVEGFTTPEGLSAPVKTFAHGRLADEAALRRRFRRVHRCHRFVRELAR